MRENDEMSILDAFCALNEIDDEDLPKVKSTKAVNEGKSFPVMNSQAMQEAKDFRESDDGDVTLEVIDANADSIEHLKDKKEYVGQVILSCQKCQSKHFVDMDKLVASENEEIYNVDDECPFCGSTGTGFKILGQVGKFDEDQPEETAEPEAVESEEGVVPDETEPLQASEENTDTDMPTLDDLAFDNEESESEETAEESNEGDETETEEETEVEVDNKIDDEEKDGMETESNEDEDEVENTFGEEYEEEFEEDHDDNSYFKEFNLTAKEKEALKNKPEETEEQPAPRKKLKLRFMKESIQGKTVNDLFDRIANPEACKDIEVLTAKGDSIFRGSYNELTPTLLNQKLISFNVADSMLVLNTDSDIDAYEPGAETVAEVLDKFDGKFNNITVFDESSDEDILTSDKKEVVAIYGELPSISIEAPKVLVLVIDGNNIKPLDTVEEEVDELTALEEDIFRTNNLSSRKVTNPKCDEYWIHESLVTGEDLKLVYEHFVKGTDLVEHFKKVTGYRDALDEAYDQVNETAPRNDNVEEAKKAAEELLNSNKAFAVIYGYRGRDGKFFALQEPLVCDTQRELKYATDAVMNRYHPSGSLYVVYNSAPFGQTNESVEITTTAATNMEVDDEFILVSSEDHNIKVKSSEGSKVNVNDDGSVEIAENDIENEEPKVDDDVQELPDDEVTEVEPVPAPEETAEEEVEENIKSFITRKELSEAVKELKAAGKDYKVRRSNKAGYRYDLIEDVDFDKVSNLVKGDGQMVVIGGDDDEEEIETPEIETSAEEKEFVDKLSHIAEKIYSEIQKVFGVDADMNLIVDDIVNDIKIVAGIGDIEALEDPNARTYAQNIANSLRSEEEGIQAALEKLNSPEFSDRRIEQIIAHPMFAELAAQGKVPYLDLRDKEDEDDDLELIDDEAEEIEESKNCCEADCCEKSDEECDQEEVCEKCGHKVSECSCKDRNCDQEEKEVLAEKSEENEVEMDIEKFDEEINEYFNESYDETILYSTSEGYVDSQGNILLKGVLESEDKIANVNFTLEPSKRMNEGVEETIYTVTNNLSNEKFEFKF